MPHTRQPSGFNWATIVQIGGIPAITLAGSIIYQTATTGDTLKRHDQQIAEEKIEREKMKAVEDEKREGLRKALTDNTAETRLAIGKLSETVAVQANEITNIDKHLEMLVNGVQRLEQTVGQSGKH